MAIKPDVIDQAVERYERERDRYLKLAAKVADICSGEIVRSNAIRAQVTSRAKTADSFREKLERFSRNPKKILPTVDEIFKQISDLAGVRIATYRPEDESRVTDALKKRFLWLNGEDIDVEVKDLLQNDGQKYYRATHCQAALQDHDLADPYENLRGTSCEIQVCSMMAHVWNEIEHDIVYKPEGAGPQVAEKVLLEALGGLTRSGDQMIAAILSASEARLEAQKGPFNDVFDFVVRSRDVYPDIDLSVNSGQFFDVLEILKLNTPEKLKVAVKDALEKPDETLQKLNLFNKFSRANWGSSFVLDPGSSDFLLILLLEKHAEKIEESLPAGRGMGRPARVRSLATRYLYYGQE